MAATSTHVKEFTDSNFESEVLKSSQPVLVDFWAEWCMPCRNLAPTIDAVADEFAGKAKIGKVDIEAHKGIPMKYGITAIPTVIIFKGGQPFKKFIGLKSRADLAAALSEAGAV